MALRSKSDMVNAMRAIEDVANHPPPLVETLVQARGHRVVWIHKYHCELNPIELA